MSKQDRHFQILQDMSLLTYNLMQIIESESMAAVLRSTQGCLVEACSSANECQCIALAMLGIAGNFWRDISKDDLQRACGNFSKVGCPNVDLVSRRIAVEKTNLIH